MLLITLANHSPTTSGLLKFSSCYNTWVGLLDLGNKRLSQTSWNLYFLGPNILSALHICVRCESQRGLLSSRESTLSTVHRKQMTRAYLLKRKVCEKIMLYFQLSLVELQSMTQATGKNLVFSTGVRPTGMISFCRNKTAGKTRPINWDQDLVK